MAKRRKLHAQLILDVGLAFAVVVLVFIVSDFYYERKLIRDALDQQLLSEIQTRLVAIRGEVERLGGEPMSKERVEALFQNEFGKLLKLKGFHDHVLAAFDANAAPVALSANVGGVADFDRVMIFESIRSRRSRGAIERSEDAQYVVSIVPVLSSIGEERSVVGALAYRAPIRRSEAFTSDLATGFILTRLVGFAFILVVLVIVIAAVTRRLIVGPIRALIVHQHAAAQGDLRRYKGRRPNNEIGDIFVMFDRVLDTLAEKSKRLKKLEKSSPKAAAADNEPSKEQEISFLPEEGDEGDESDT